MNVVYYLWSFPKLSKSCILNEIYELERSGHNVAVCSLQEPNERIQHEEFDELNIPIYYPEGPSYSDVLKLLSPKSLHPRILKNAVYRASPQQHAANLLRAKRCIEFIEALDWEPDHFHTHFATLPKFGARYAASYYHVPFTITTHAFDLYEEPVGTYTGSLLRSADRIVTISEYNKKYIREQFASRTPIDVVRAGIRPEKFAPSESTVPNRVLSIARFVEKKGLRYAIEAVGIAVKQLPDIEYHIIGSGRLRSKLKQKVVESEIENNVTFLDNVSDHRLVTEINQAHCFLLPCVIAASGDRDGIPVALMEAMAMKTPPVSTTVSGIPELIDHGENGLLTEPRNASATADALLELLQNDVDWRNYTEQARKKVIDKFNVENEVEKLESTFQKATE